MMAFSATAVTRGRPSLLLCQGSIGVLVVRLDSAAATKRVVRDVAPLGDPGPRHVALRGCQPPQGALAKRDCTRLAAVDRQLAPEESRLVIAVNALARQMHRA